MITNDKFCGTRWGQRQLSWWRRPLRLRSGADPEPRESILDALRQQALVAGATEFGRLHCLPDCSLEQSGSR
jgi:hypothetical protein